jgi:hypothetical protein
LAGLITGMSTTLYGYLGRSAVIPRQFTERYDGNGRRQMFVKQYPIFKISALAISGTLVPAAATPGAGVNNPSGYLASDWDGVPPGSAQVIDLLGGWPSSFGLSGLFVRGRQNVVLTYTAGYFVANEAATIPASPGPYTIAPVCPYGPWACDLGVTYANGTALTPVTGTPATGQYQINITDNSDASEPPYARSVAVAFAAADTGKAVLLSYGYIPGTISRGCLEWAAERYKYSSRIGERSRGMGQSTTSFDLSEIPATIQKSLEPFRNVLPIF